MYSCFSFFFVVDQITPTHSDIYRKSCFKNWQVVKSWNN